MSYPGRKGKLKESTYNMVCKYPDYGQNCTLNCIRLYLGMANNKWIEKMIATNRMKAQIWNAIKCNRLQATHGMIEDDEMRFCLDIGNIIWYIIDWNKQKCRIPTSGPFFNNTQYHWASESVIPWIPSTSASWHRYAVLCLVPFPKIISQLGSEECTAPSNP